MARTPSRAEGAALAHDEDVRTQQRYHQLSGPLKSRGSAWERRVPPRVNIGPDRFIVARRSLEASFSVVPSDGPRPPPYAFTPTNARGLRLALTSLSLCADIMVRSRCTAVAEVGGADCSELARAVVALLLFTLTNRPVPDPPSSRSSQFLLPL
ncbi:hypothetical protein EVAR_29853_1 [Eumeta japonica]|uniref:Uncharacterized protein n=1 Tax=Eumeta variegata TaxID=151549 RepID=A0A4C1VWP5_EUMVA|nr:hypothetical protein EVAR_29853_1 [Eumeta japonica]